MQPFCLCSQPYTIYMYLLVYSVCIQVLNRVPYFIFHFLTCWGKPIQCEIYIISHCLSFGDFIWFLPEIKPLFSPQVTTVCAGLGHLFIPLSQTVGLNPLHQSRDTTWLNPGSPPWPELQISSLAYHCTDCYLACPRACTCFSVLVIMLCQHAPLISVQLGSKAGLAETHWPLYWVALHWGCTGFDASLKEIIAGLVLDAKLMLGSRNIVTL